MSNRILTEAGWEKRIQDKLGVDPAYLPDEVIRQPDIIGVAEANIIEQIPDYEELDGDKRTYLESAIVCECCALLSPTMPVRLPRKESGPHASHELGIDWDKKKKDFERERDGYIGKILSTSPLLYFGVTSPRRW